MTLDEIREECREKARDTAIIDADRLWPDSDMNRYINRTYYDLVRKTRCIKDARTAAICLLALTPVDYTTYTPGTLDALWAADTTSPLFEADVAPYVIPLHASILEVLDAKLSTAGTHLTKVTSEKWMRNVKWEHAISTPTEYATDLQNRSIAVNFRSLTEETIQIRVSRMPLIKLSADLDEPEMREDYHEFIMPGVLMQMYKKQDAETIDLAKAADYKEEYDQAIDDMRFQEFRLNDRLKVNFPMLGNL